MVTYVFVGGIGLLLRRAAGLDGVHGAPGPGAAARPGLMLFAERASLVEIAERFDEDLLGFLAPG